MGEPARERSSVATWRSISSSESEDERERERWPSVCEGVRERRRPRLCEGAGM